MRSINQPQTFERRGTTVPFRQKDLAHTRVREYFHGKDRLLEAVIPNYSGTRRGELVVVPWDQLTRMATLDDRDAKVHEGVAGTIGTRDLDPINIREICLKADMACGIPDIQRAAGEVVERDRQDQAMVRLSCIAQLTRECGIARGDSLMARTNTRTLMDLMGTDTGRSKIDLDLLIERVMIFAAERAKITIDEAKSYLEPLVGMITPFGNVTGDGEEKDNGFLFLQHTKLIEFHAQVTGHRAEVRDEMQVQIDRIVEAAEECIGYVNERLTSLNQLLGQIADMFDENVGGIDRLDRLRRDVGYGLDGWQDMIAVWDQAYAGREAIGGSQAMERAILRIAGYAPRIPVRELIPDHELVGKGIEIERARLRMVNQMHSWDTDQLDAELQARVEKGRKRGSYGMVRHTDERSPDPPKADAGDGKS